MPNRPTRACLHPACPNPAHYRGRCKTHAHQREIERGTPTQRGYDTEWRELVRLAIAQHPWCSDCGTTTDLTGDHIHPLAAGGTSTLNNIAVRCRSCNSRKGTRRVP